MRCWCTARRPDVGITTSSKSSPIHPGGAEDVGVEGNARMTALLGAILLVAFLTEGVTILSVNQWFTWHVFLGLFIVPVVCVKLATTGYRFFNYYRGTAPYRRKGAPHPVLRVTAPLLVVSTLSLLGADLVAEGHAIPVARVQAMHEGKRRARARRKSDGDV